MADADWLILEHEGWVVEQCLGCVLPGYVLVRPAVAARTLSPLPEDTAAQLGPLLQLVIRGIEAVLRPVRIYIAQFGEELQDVHFHVFPRTDALTAEYLQEFPEHRSLISGPLLFDWARNRYRGGAASDETVQACRALRQHFGMDR